MTPVKVKKLNENAIIPTYGTEFSAGADLYALPGDSITVEPHKTVMIHTGLSMEIPEGYAGLIFARSGLASKKGLAPANKVGVVDSDYRGEFMVALHNHTDEPKTVDGGERVAQLVIVPFLKAAFEEAEELCETARGAGGFGSTGTK
jgi:dUTP pyrophosphatase